MIQLAQPNLSAVGRIGWCLEYQSRLWGTTHTEPYAWTAWMNTKHPHTDAPPTDVAYPLWFSYFAGGLNQGHVISFVPGQGYYSSPWQAGTSHAVLPSISEVERIYGVKYVGWSEDILEKQVIGGSNVSKEEVTVMYMLAVPGQAVNQDFVKVYTGKPLDEVLHALQNDPSIQKYINGLLNPTGAAYSPYAGPPLFIKI